MPLDSLQWEYLKGKLYQNMFKYIEDLKDRIKKEIISLSAESIHMNNVLLGTDHFIKKIKKNNYTK
ncbi:hypothetical protein ABEB36_003788, partial [Hypothenemus hampei]